MKKAVLISCFDWYKSRLKPIRDILIKKKYEVTILTTDYDHIKKRQIEKKYSECTYIHVPQYKRNISINRIWSHFVFGWHADKAIDSIQPDLIYCLVPPNIVSQHCRKYKENHPHIVFIVDIIDLWPESMPIGFAKKTFPAKIWRRWRDDAVEVADYVFTECDLYRKKLKSFLKSGKTNTLYLFKEQSLTEQKQVAAIIDGYRRHEKSVRFAYVGSMNSIIDIDGICNIIVKFQSEGYHCELLAIGDGENRERFQQAVESTGCDAHFFGVIYDEKEKIRLLAPCDFGFNMMKDSVSVGLTIKSIDYMSYGLPIINNIKGDTWRMVEKEGIGLNCDDLQFPLSEFNHSRIRSFYISMFSVESFRKRIESCLSELNV